MRYVNLKIGIAGLLISSLLSCQSRSLVQEEEEAGEPVSNAHELLQLLKSESTAYELEFPFVERQFKPFIGDNLWLI